jgi:hypothetical protein
VHLRWTIRLAMLCAPMIDQQATNKAVPGPRHGLGLPITSVDFSQNAAQSNSGTRGD